MGVTVAVSCIVVTQSRKSLNIPVERVREKDSEDEDHEILSSLSLV